MNLIQVGRWVSLILFCLTLINCGKAKTEELDPNPTPPAEIGRTGKVIHLYVALCDNESQGIAPVPKKIGNGDDPPSNLYWGCSDGARPIFTKSPHWKRLSVGKVEGRPEILERVVFEHKKNQAILVADAWRGSEIKACMSSYRKALAGQEYESLSLSNNDKERKLNISGGADLLAFIGHNGLMEFQLPDYPANPHRKQSVDAIVLCCKSQSYFTPHLEKAGVRPRLLTASNMYPGAFILHDVLEGWFIAEEPTELRKRAAKAYAKNQGISVKGASTVFAKIPLSSSPAP